MVHLVRRTARRISSYWQLLTRRDRVTAGMDEEMRFHVEMETERLMKAYGLPVEEARRRALVGGAEDDDIARIEQRADFARARDRLLQHRFSAARSRRSRV